jgi:hypothetical protein
MKGLTNTFFTVTLLKLSDGAKGTLSIAGSVPFNVAEDAMQHLPEQQRPQDYTEFSLVQYKRAGRPRGPRRDSTIVRIIKWIAGPLVGALLTRWASGHFP